eukprot:GHVR01049149.1.p1 GENE.GHVR01049149.1~~GHVR01049149.1.p1  ORF type:complete len:277 (+),score=87.77 GHVR01049149.1:41-871(+)
MKAFCRRFSVSSFQRVFDENVVKIGRLDKMTIAVSSAYGAVKDPTQGHLVAALGEVTGVVALNNMYKQMIADSDGLSVIRDKPLITTDEIDLDHLRSLPKHTLGYAYIRFMDTYGFHPHERSPVCYIDDIELAYVMTRYRQLHDFAHAAFNLNINEESEVALKCIEMIQTGLPMTGLATIFGTLATPETRVVDTHTHTHTHTQNNDNNNTPIRELMWPKEVLRSHLLPWAVQAGLQMKRPLHTVYVEKWLEKPLDDFRKHMGIVLAPSSVRKFSDI